MQNKFVFTASIWNYWEDKNWKETHFVDFVMLSCHWKIAGQISTPTKSIAWYPPSNLLQRDPKQPIHKQKRSNSSNFKVIRFYLILLWKQHNWTLGTYSIAIIYYTNEEMTQFQGAPIFRPHKLVFLRVNENRYTWISSMRYYKFEECTPWLQ